MMVWSSFDGVDRLEGPLAYLFFFTLCLTLEKMHDGTCGLIWLCPFLTCLIRDFALE